MHVRRSHRGSLACVAMRISHSGQRRTRLTHFVQSLLNGLSIGSIYAIFALGYTLVFSILGIINFAHGAIFTAGAYFTYVLTGAAFGFNGVLANKALPFGLAFVLAMIVGSLLAGCLSVLDRTPRLPAPASPRRGSAALAGVEPRRRHCRSSISSSTSSARRFTPTRTGSPAVCPSPSTSAARATRSRSAPCRSSSSASPA